MAGPTKWLARSVTFSTLRTVYLAFDGRTPHGLKLRRCAKIVRCVLEVTCTSETTQSTFYKTCKHSYSCPMKSNTRISVETCIFRVGQKINPAPNQLLYFQRVHGVSEIPIHFFIEVIVQFMSLQPSSTRSRPDVRFFFFAFF